MRRPARDHRSNAQRRPAEMFQHTDTRSISLALYVRERPILIRSSSRRTHGRQLRSEFRREMQGIDGMESPPNPPHLSPRSFLRRLDGRWGNWVFQILLEFQRAYLCKPRIFNPVSLPTSYLLIFSLAGDFESSSHARATLYCDCT